MSLGLIALLLCAAAAGYLLWRTAKASSGGSDARNLTLLKAVGFLALAAVLFAAKLWPLAFMVLLAAGTVTGIEIWKERAIKASEAAETTPPAPRTRLSAGEAASILGVAADADADAVRAAHKRLIGALHPDKGGTDYLAAKINDARDVLLAREKAPPP
jgi:hypothetical protein